MERTKKGLMNRAEIASVEEGSIAYRHGIRSGDILISVNGKKIRDFIDYQNALISEKMSLLVRRAGSGEESVIEIVKDACEDIGIAFSDFVFDGIRRCANKCIFCFIDQMPPGLRPGLYIKDDDYRYSVLCGNYITLTNLGEREIERIIENRISPLYISVHTTDEELRMKMLGSKRRVPILDLLRRFAENGIDFHLQIVLCPGVNDGKVLEDTLNDLESLYPSVISIGAVPVGITKYREGLYPLKPFDRKSASAVIELIKGFQRRFLREYGTRLVYPSDELYLTAEEEIPGYEEYEGFPQLENGIGMTRIIRSEFEDLEPSIPGSVPGNRRVIFVTSVLGSKAIAPIVDRLKRVKGLSPEPLVVENRFFGENVTVTGLLTGRDIADKIKSLERGEGRAEILLPSIVLKKGERILLDDMRVEDLPIPPGFVLKVVEPTAEGIVNALFKEAESGIQGG